MTQWYVVPAKRALVGQELERAPKPETFEPLFEVADTGTRLPQGDGPGTNPRRD